ncbi:hypothetical protein [Agromyces sp. Marseille-Q5079]|uniref:hypothetical protein n=1 Tax=Agromyces sp. Marseille-Q5079 TaxID=3439059 RepID=UPI003D9C93FC
MSAERSDEFRRAAKAVLRWCALYTRGLEPSVAAGRLDEIASDLHEHAVWAGSTGVSVPQLARSVRLRAVRGAAADLAWRTEQARSADRQLRFALRSNAALLSTMLAAAVVVAGASGFVLVRVIRALAIGDIGYVPSRTLWLAVICVASLVSAVLLLRRRTRVIGAALLALPAVLVFPLAGNVLWYVSASTTLVFHVVPWWGLPAWLLGVGLGMLCLAGAAYWWDLDRPSRAVKETVHV